MPDTLDPEVLVSIIIPAYNAERFIAETIQSVLLQTYSNWELIIIDDGSIDNTAQIVKSFLEDGRVKYFSQKNSGVSSARNTGINYSSGKYIAFLDADDIWETENLKKKKRFLDSNQDVGIVISYMQAITEDSVKTNHIFHGMEGKVLDKLLLWDKSSLTAPSNILMRREVITKVGVWDKELSTAADQELFFRIASKYKIGRIAEVLCFYRYHSNSMHRVIELMERDHILAYKKAKAKKLFHSQMFEQQCFSNMYLILAGCCWVNANNKTRAVYYILKALMIYPFNIEKLFKKFG